MSNERKPGDLEFCDSDGNCIINLGFIPDIMSIDADGKYIAEDNKGHRYEGIVPFGSWCGNTNA